MSTYYYNFGTINSRKIFFQETNKEIPLKNILTFNIEKKWNFKLIFFSSSIFLFFNFLNFFFVNLFFFELLFIFSIGFFFLVLKHKFLFYVIIISSKDEETIIPEYFFTKKKAIRFSKRIMNKIDSYKKRKNFFLSV